MAKTKTNKSNLTAYRLLAGRHSEGDKTYKKGNIVWSRHDLPAMFGANKFRPLDHEVSPNDYDGEDNESMELEESSAE